MHGRPITVIGAHPFHADIELLGGVPIGLRTAARNEDLEVLRKRVAELEDVERDVLLLGDFNTAPTEPAFGRLTSGLHDAHADIGIGPGWTWRPGRLAFLGTGILRIDLVLSTARLEPLRIGVDCAVVGDHCLVDATLELLPESSR
jgi:endonuclease/exonuclease/phosphatase family metal-dependent hydrolase